MLYCSNCGAGASDDALFCPECGTKMNVGAAAAAAMPTPEILANPATAQSPPTKPGAHAGGDIQHFLRVSLPDVMKRLFFDPLDGTKKILTEVKEPAKIGLYCILISSVLISLLIYTRIPPEVRTRLNFVEFFLKFMMLPVIGAFIIAFFSFIVKAINDSKRANFGSEILTGGIVSIGYATFVVIAFLFSYFAEGSLSGLSRSGPFGGYQGGSGFPTFLVIIAFSIFIYLFTVTSNSLSQSFRGSGVKDAVSFYLSPFIVIISGYVTVRLWIALFAGDGFGLNNISPFN